ncbi:DUF6356 family protein [Sphingomonas sp. RG327]|jgi:hypothetical protein|uniref:DUF6356 family protein n=1 Tax=Sphingomonas anseongensis TaxID=2908207 RepID=A0ABT0REN1_9SPHN|nr:DUF6356 family protein [Sphingomonas anseongensis]MCL6678734.1 DUF6356 family protein [Sphingomonas anseongensis]
MATTKQRKLEESQGGIVDRLFLEHPRSLDMSWAGHGAGAVKVGLQLIGAGIAALIHAVVPGIFGETASTTVIRMHDHIQKLNAKRDA